jgi:hypothetical protein
MNDQFVYWMLDVDAFDGYNFHLVETHMFDTLFFPIYLFI